jgi:hypothetical protein
MHFVDTTGFKSDAIGGIDLVGQLRFALPPSPARPRVLRSGKVNKVRALFPSMTSVAPLGVQRRATYDAPFE